MSSVDKVVVVGLDGLDPKLTESMMARGELPNLANLAQCGGYARLSTTTPAQTPVAWSTFATGTNPGGHGIYDFLNRDPDTYLPDQALSRYEQKSSFLPPTAVNLRRGTTLWEILSDRSVESVVLRCPCTFPPPKGAARILAGMGVTDVRGGLGTSTFYTSASDVRAGDSETVVPLERVGPAGAISTHLIGPKNPKSGEEVTFEIELRPEPSRRRVRIHSDGDPHVLDVEEGQWSGWLKVKFKFSLLQTLRGMVRFYLRRLEPELDLYASPVNFDPDSPEFRISEPWDYAGELEREVGTFYTTGMVEDHTGLTNGRFEEEAFLAQCQDVLEEREAMASYELDRLEEGFFFCLFDTPDRIQHMFWRFREPDHPANDGEDRVPEMRKVIESHYREADGIVGRAMEKAGEDALVIVLSDHGFASFQRGVHLNTWLYQEGLLHLEDGATPGGDAGNMLERVDWARTQAYALGLGSLYLNRAGREAEGIVGPEESKRLEARIKDGLGGLVDPGRGEVAVRSVVSRDEVYSGPHVDKAPDLIVNFAPGYRVSWGTAMGEVPEGCIEDNTRKWGGDHIVDPACVPGVLFMDRPFETEDASMVDLAPTILGALGVEKGENMEGKSLFG